MTSEIVIARYNEDLDWIGRIAADYKVIVYNKGAPVKSAGARQRADLIVDLANGGRESDTFLHHILAKAAYDDGYTVFLQGDPFEHSPDTIRLLEAEQQWRDLQPLSWCWRPERNLPPQQILDQDTSGFVNGGRVRPELFSLSSWEQIQFFDSGARVIADWYRHIHDLPDGINIAGHFLRRCEWPDLAEQAERHLVGRFAYGGMFAVRQSRLRDLPRKSLQLALEAVNGHEVYGYIVERLWLHLCGEAFLMPAPGPSFYRENLTQLPTRFVPPAVRKPLHLRVVPALKRRVSTWASN